MNREIWFRMCVFTRCVKGDGVRGLAKALSLLLQVWKGW